MYREGYVARVTKDETWYDAHGFHSDSGAGLFDDAGRLTGVMSGYRLWGNGQGFTFAVMFSYPLAFTAAQWQDIKN